MILITGSAGYVGNVLTENFIKNGKSVIGLDLYDTNLEYSSNADSHLLGSIYSERVDITNPELLENIFNKYKNITTIIHCAAQLFYKKSNKEFFYNTNITATNNLIKLAIKYDIKNFIFISSNCVYGRVNSLDINEQHATKSFEEYGNSKIAAENILWQYKDQINITIFRPPTIVGAGRLGILSIVFDFIRENRKLYLVGSGNNRYQFIGGNDLFNACHHAINNNISGIYNIGTDNPPSLVNLFESLINHANSKTKIYHLPAFILIPAMKVCYKLGISPLGPYQYNMITSNYIGNTNLIKQQLNWQPTKTNTELLIDAYQYYIDNYDSIHSCSSYTGHRKAGKAGIIKLLKYLS